MTNTWGLNNDEYPDDPDYECNTCGHTFNEPWDWDNACPECESKDIHGGGYYG
jgi:predicted Zn-ribbon and HTH transcriptional regulator